MIIENDLEHYVNKKNKKKSEAQRYVGLFFSSAGLAL
jgi:hypothetical protein